jgi:hypothetical protein
MFAYLMVDKTNELNLTPAYRTGVFSGKLAVSTIILLYNQSIECKLS